MVNRIRNELVAKGRIVAERHDQIGQEAEVNGLRGEASRRYMKAANVWLMLSRHMLGEGSNRCVLNYYYLLQRSRSQLLTGSLRS